MHCTHSILARRMDTNEAKAGNLLGSILFHRNLPLVWLLPRYSSPTPQRTLRGEYSSKNSVRGEYSNGCPTNAGPRTTSFHTIDFEKLQQELGRSPQVENQTADSQNSECPESESQPPTVQNQNTYIDTTPIHHYLHKRQPMLCKKTRWM